MSDLGNEAPKSADSTLTQVADALLRGKKLKIIVPSHDDRMIVPDLRLQEPHASEIFFALRSPDPDLKTYVNRHLFPVENHYQEVANYLFTPGSKVLRSSGGRPTRPPKTYEDWLAILADQMDQYLQSEYSQFKNVADEAWRLDGLETDPKLKEKNILADVAELEDKDILAAVAVIYSANQIAERLVVSDSVVPCDLDAVTQLAQWHSFCDASFKFWDSEKSKEDDHHEIRLRNLRKAQKAVRQEIRNKLSQLIPDKESSQYFHSGGERSGQPYFECIIKVLNQEFASDDEWKTNKGKKRRTPSKKLMHEEIERFCANR